MVKRHRGIMTRLTRVQTCNHPSYTYITGTGFVCDVCGQTLSKEKIMMKERFWAGIAEAFGALQGMKLITG